MFAKPSNPTNELEKLINKATDGTLTTDNWQYILDVCDCITQNPEENTKQAIKIITLRMSSKDANVLLRTLSLLTAVAENCGSRMKQEIATKSFLYDCLIKKLNEKKIHHTIKSKVAEVICQLHESFKLDPSLKPMTDAYNTVNLEYKQYLHKAGPSKPQKTQLSKQDKQKEDDDLQRVLKLSLQEYEKEQSFRKAYLNSKPLPETKKEDPKIEEPKKDKEKTIATVSKVRALYDLISYEPDELSFSKGDVITVIELVYRDWWRGSLPSGKIGIFPLNYVTPIVNKSPAELEKENFEEDKILMQDLKKVDRLLGLLSTNSPDLNEDEITQLYNEVLPLRPALAKAIDKYSVRKEELLALNGQLNVQVKYFNQLVDDLINQRIQHPSPTNNYYQYNSSTPYPSEPVSQNYSQQPLSQQPTSSGFGNASANYNRGGYNSPNGGYEYPPSNPPPTTFQSQGLQAPQDAQNEYRPYLNINNFPTVSDL